MSFAPLLLVAAQALVSLHPGQDVEELPRSTYVLLDPQASLTLSDAIAARALFHRNTDANIVNPGTITGVAWMRIDVRNEGADRGEWVFSLNKTILDPGEIYLVTDQGTQTLLTTSADAFAHSYAEFGTLAARFQLDPGAQGSIYVRFRGGNWSGTMVSITTEATLRARVSLDLTIFVFIVGGIVSLVLYASVSFVFLSRQIMLLYSFAQIVFLFFFAHFGGYTTVYLWPHSPNAGRIVTPVAIVVFAATMVQFARRFFETHDTLPRLDRCFRGYLIVLLLALVLMPLDYVVDSFDRRIPVFLAQVTIILAWLSMSGLAIQATLKRSRDYWPIAVAWSLMALFILAMQGVFSGAIPFLPLGKNLYGATVYIEALLLALAIALRIRAIRRERALAQERLAESLRSELESHKTAARLAEEREWAIADLAEKGRLLLAAGHDTRQMLSAMKHYSTALQRNPESERIAKAGRDIAAIAEKLDEVLSTAVTGSFSGGIADSVLVLERIDPDDLLAPLKLIHGQSAADKGLELRWFAGGGDFISDRVLITRVLSNFISNAIKYTDAGKVLVACRAAANARRLQVFDTGRGMSPSQVEQLMDSAAGDMRFDVQTEGHGTGIHISRDIAGRLGARIRIRSVPGSGSLFELHVPTAHHVPESIAGIVLADSDAETRARAEAYGAAFGVAVACAVRPAAVESLVAERASPQLVLIDRHFGGTDNGLGLARRISRLPQARVALLSYDRSITARMQIPRECALVLQKPLAPDLIETAAGFLLREQRR